MASYRGINLGALTNYKTGNLASFVLGIFYIIFPWLSLGQFVPEVTIFGLVFLTIAVMRAKASNAVLSGLAQAFIGVIYVFAIAGIIDVAFLWILSIGLVALFFILELGFIKIGPITKKADAFQIVPLTILSFGLMLSIAGYSDLFVVSWSSPLIALNFVAILLFCLFSLLQIAGWNVAGKSTNTMILLFAVGAIATAILSVYQGSLLAWA